MVSGPLILAEAAAGPRSGHPAGIVLLVAGVVIIVLGLLRLFRLLPGRNANPALAGGLMILAGLALAIVGFVLAIVR